MKRWKLMMLYSVGVCQSSLWRLFFISFYSSISGSRICLYMHPVHHLRYFSTYSWTCILLMCICTFVIVSFCTFLYVFCLLSFNLYYGVHLLFKLSVWSIKRHKAQISSFQVSRLMWVCRNVYEYYHFKLEVFKSRTTGTLDKHSEGG